MTPMTTETLLGYGRDYYLPVYRPRELVLARGQGARLWDAAGRDFIDFGAGIAVCSLGHCDPDLVAGARAALARTSARASIARRSSAMSSGAKGIAWAALPSYHGAKKCRARAIAQARVR